MPAKPAARPYKWLAEYYDEIFTDHAAWFQLARKRAIEPLMGDIRSACDLACGTGATAITLARRGLKTFAVDLTESMCRQARRKAREAGVTVKVIRADMRDFRLPEPVDLVLCEYDALNHLPRARDLSKVLRSVSRALNPRGLFFFDVNNRFAFERVWTGGHIVETPDVALLLRGWLDKKRKKGVCEADWFIRQGRLWRREKEVVEQVFWPAREMRAALRASGFQVKGAWDASAFFANSPGGVSGARTFYLAGKAP